MRVAVLGTGIMGAGMARSLRRDGHDVVVWNRTKERAEPLGEEGIAVAGSVGSAVEGADAVITILFDVEAVLAVRDELTAALGSNAIWLQASTVGPDGMHRIMDGIDAALLDMPVLGTKKPAEAGKLIVLASGPAALIEAVEPVFDAIGTRTVVVGDELGQASALKLVCNSWIAMITAGTAQSIAFADCLGVDLSLFLEAIEGTATDSAYAQLKGKAILAGDYRTSFAVDGIAKDIALMLDAAHGCGFPDDLLVTVHGTFERASGAGHGDEDMAAVRFAFDS